MDNPFSDHKTVLRAVAPDFEKDNKIPFGLHTAVIAFCLCPKDTRFRALPWEWDSPVSILRVVVLKLFEHHCHQPVGSPFFDDFNIAVMWAMCTLIRAVCELPPLTRPFETFKEIENLNIDQTMRRLVPKLYPKYWNTSWDPKVCLEYFWQLLENSERTGDHPSSLNDKVSPPGTSASTVLSAPPRSPTLSSSTSPFPGSQGSELGKNQPSNRTDRSLTTMISAPMEAKDRQLESSKNGKKRKHVDTNRDEEDTPLSKLRRVDSAELLHHTYEKKLLDAEKNHLETKQLLLAAEVKIVEQRTMHLEKEKELRDRIKAWSPNSRARRSKRQEDSSVVVARA